MEEELREQKRRRKTRKLYSRTKLGEIIKEEVTRLARQRAKRSKLKSKN